MRLLKVDLTSQEAWAEDIPKKTVEKHVGGRSLGSHLLLETDPDYPPLSEEAHLLFMTSPLVGVFPCANRTCVVGVSPANGLYSFANAGGKFAIALRKAGFDAVDVFGAAKRPVYLSIIDGVPEIVSAGHLWGKTTGKVRQYFKNYSSVACIGPAGEKLVKFAGIQMDERSAARTGLGSVLGYKKLKAIAVSGNQPIPGEEEVREIIPKAMESLKSMIPWGEVGTLDTTDLVNPGKCYPVNNYRENHLPDEKLARIDFRGFKPLVKGRGGCMLCPVQCARDFETSWKEVRDGPEYETAWSFGANLENYDPKIIIDANALCDEYGLDTISTGVVLAWLKEASEKGIVPYDFNSASQITELIKMIGRREGIGDDLAEGVLGASEKYGGKEFAVHAYGVELAAYDPRSVPGMLISYALGSKKGSHLNAWTVAADIKAGKKRFSPKEVARRANRIMVDNTIPDVLCICRFVRDAEGLEALAAQALSRILGKKYTSSSIRRIADSTLEKEREISLLRGMEKEKETFTERILSQDPGVEGHRLTEEEFERIKEEFYRLRGW